LGGDSESSGSKKDIPLPGVRTLPEYERETVADFALPLDSYLQYSPPSWFETAIYFERGRVEYCIDDEDLNWLVEQRIPEQVLDEEAMEMLIDVLEKESFRQLEFRQITTQIPADEAIDVDPEDEDDKPCCACGGKDWDEENLILFCDGCDLPVHQQCIDLKQVPEGDWFCDACVFRTKKIPSATVSHQKKLSSSPSSKSDLNSALQRRNGIDFSIPVPCVLCGMVDGGMFKRTNLSGKLVHVVCALMTPEVWFERDWANVSKALLARKNIVCQVCGYAGGVVKCSHRGCNNHHHVPCARENGQMLYFNVPDPDEEGEEEEIRDLLMMDVGLIGEAQDPLIRPSSSSLPFNDASITGSVLDDNSETLSERNGGMDESFSEVDILGGVESLNVSTVSSSVASEKPSSSVTTAGTGSEQNQKKRKRKTAKAKKAPHQPYQSLCGLHSAMLKVKKLEQARKASLQIPVEVGKFLEQEQNQDENLSAEEVVGDTTTFSKSVDIMKKFHSKRLLLQRPVYDQVVEYWKRKRLSKRLGHMPLIFQLHVLVTHFKENFDAGRTLTNRPRQVELTLAQYTPEKKFQILKDLRDGVESLRTILDLVKKREVKKKQAMEARLKLFDAIMKQGNPREALRVLYESKKGSRSPTYFSITPTSLTIVIPTSALPKWRARERMVASSSSPPFLSPSSSSTHHLATPPPKKKSSPIISATASSSISSSSSSAETTDDYGNTISAPSSTSSNTTNADTCVMAALNESKAIKDSITGPKKEETAAPFNASEDVFQLDEEAIAQLEDENKKKEEKPKEPVSEKPLKELKEEAKKREEATDSIYISDSPPTSLSHLMDVSHSTNEHILFGSDAVSERGLFQEQQPQQQQLQQQPGNNSLR